MHDRTTGQTTRVSARADGNSYGDAYHPALSPDGRYVAFASSDDELVSSDSNGVLDVFVHDRTTGQTTRVSTSSTGSANDGDSYAPAISASGRYVAFESQATNLVDDDGNTHIDVFLHDRTTGQTARVSLDSDNGEGNGDSVSPVLSVDGRYVAFASEASNLVGGDGNGQQDVFVRDRGVIRAAFELAIQFPDLRMAKSAVPGAAGPGASLVYALAFANTGQITATGVLVTDVVPPQVSVQSAASSGLSITQLGSAYAWSVEDMAPGAAGWITLSGRLASPLPAGLTVTNTAIITTTAMDANPANNQAEAVTTILASQPQAADDYGATNEDSVLAAGAPGVLANDIDPNDDELTVTVYDSVSAHGVGVTVGADGAYTYDPRPVMQWLAAGEILTDSFAYTASDGILTDTATVWITVTGNNDAPQAYADAYATDEDSPINRDAADGVLANDNPVDTNDTAAVTAFGASLYGASVTIGADGSLSYDPTPADALQAMPAGDVRTDTFTYTVADGHGERSTATVTVVVTGINDPPAVTDDEAYTLENTPVTVDVLANDEDVDGGTLSLVAVGVPANGQAALSGGGWVVYTPTFDFYGTEVFTYMVGDGQGGFSLGRVTVTVAPLADLGIAKRADPPYAFPGHSLSYALTFSNSGHVTATGIVISDAIAYLISPTFAASGVAVTATGGTPYVWQVTDMPPGTGGLIVVTGRVITTLVSGQTYTNTAAITTTTPDRQPANNTSSVGTKVPEADLILTKTVSPEPVVAGTELVYTITITNLGPDEAYGLVLSDTLPPSTTFGLLDQVDSADGGYSPGFEDGTFQNTRWVNPRPGTNDDEWVELINTTLSGTFTSRVMDAGNVVAWDRLSWAPRRPTWKELPGSGRAETAYALGNANMGGNRILLHLNETAGTTCSNDSGLGDDGSCPAASGESCPTPGAEGRFNAALGFDGVQSNTVAISDTHNPLRYAIELWVRPAVITDTSLVLRTDLSGTQFSHLLGISFDGHVCHFIHSVNDGRERVVVGTTEVQTGTWYHLVGTAESGGDIKLYVNGRQEARRDGIGPLWAGGDQYRLGSAYGPAGSTRYFSGELDEVAVYSRTLSASEVSDHYLRGALRLGFQVRSCDDTGCTGEPFTGPGGSEQTLYSELSNAGLGLPAVALDAIPSNRYFQYRAVFSSDEPAYSPELRRVSVGPDHPTVAPSLGSCVTSGDPPAFTCAANTLPSGGVITVVARLAVDPSALGVITNTALVTAFTPDPNLPNAASITSTVIALSRLVVGKDDWEDPVNLGGQIVYELHAHNYGPSTARAVTLTDSLPAGLIGYPQPQGDWSCTPPGNAITCTIPRLSVGEHWGVVLITATAPMVEGTITNTAWITTVTPVYTTTTLSAIERTWITPLADLAIVKYAYPDPVDPGETLTYTIVVTNIGPYTATNVRVTDDLPSNVSGITLHGGDWSCSLAGHRVTCDLPYPLPPEGSASFQVAATAPVSGLLINRASVTSDTYDPDDANDEIIVYSAVRAVADLSVSKTDNPDPVYAGTPLTYTLVVTNTGPMPAGAFTSMLVFTNQREIDIRSMGRAQPYRTTLNLSSIPGAIQDITVTLHGLSHEYPADLGVLLVGPDERGVVLMGNAGGGVDAEDVTLAFNDAGIPLPLSGTLSSTVTYQPTNYGLSGDFRQPAPDGPYGSSLSAFKGSSPNGFWRLYVYDYVESIGGEIAGGWSLHLVTRMITDRVSLTDTLPAGLSGVSVIAPSGWTCGQSGGQIVCETEQLGVNAPVTFRINSTAPITGGVITNSVVISSTTIDYDPTFNQSAITTTVVAVSDLGIAKAAEPAWVEPGGRITYTLSISNIGPSPLAGAVTVSDVLPAGLSSVSVASGAWACDTSGLPSLLCTIDGLAVGPAPDIVITANAPLTGGNTVITNTAGIVAVALDPVAANNSALVTVTVGDLAIAGLQAFNDSPTILGDPTTLSATITAGTNVAFAWAFGDGQSGAGQTLIHTYAATGTYTAIVTATNSRGSMTATTQVLVEKPAYAIFLPLACKNCVHAPDLVVDSLVVTSRAVTVTIRNQGDEPVSQIFGNEFWVDVYINPDHAPGGPINWELLGPQGLAWGITQDALPLNPGTVITLTAWWTGEGITDTVGSLYFRPDESTVTWTLPLTSEVWAQVDSTGYPTTTFGAVLENHEILELEYNNIVGPLAPAALQSTAAARQARRLLSLSPANVLSRDKRLAQASRWTEAYVRREWNRP
ncbi:MAG: DUF11 domain-containing protein [Thermoflexales bacterium]|nr:DUF11 domain-containing protein [Thermoflexales bacterium]